MTKREENKLVQEALADPVMRAACITLAVLKRLPDDAVREAVVEQVQKLIDANAFDFMTAKGPAKKERT